MSSRGEETKARILEAAVQEFSEKGFHGARVDAIAERAGVNKQRIYAYFESKEKLFGEVLKSAMQAINEYEQVFRDLGEEDIPRLGEKMLRGYVDFHQRVPYFWRLIAWENLSGGEHVEGLSGLRKATMTHLRGLYTRGQSNGVFRKDVSFETFLYVMSALSFFFFSNRHTISKTLDLDLFDPGVQNRIIEEMLRLLVA